MRSPIVVPVGRPPTRQRTAFHEAGHAVFAYAFGWKFKQITIVPASDGTFGSFEHRANRAFPKRYTGTSAQQRKIEQYMMIILAGAAGEHLMAVLAGDTGEDEEKTWDAEYRHNDLLGKDNDCLLRTAKLITRGEIETNAYCEWLFRRTKAIIVRLVWQHAVRDLAELLLDKDTLQSDAAVACIEPCKATLRGAITP